MIRDSTAGVLRHWKVEPVTSVQRATSGTMNETWLITTAQRRLVLRKHRRTQRDQIAFEHAVITHARQRGIPCPGALVTGDGEPIVDHDGAFYSLFDFARGRQVPRAELTAGHAHAMGVMLARLDLALADFPVQPQVVERPSDLTPVIATVDQLLDHLEQQERPPEQDRRADLDQRAEQDRWAAEFLRSKAAWLRTAAPPIWRPPPVEALQLVHGDYQESNLFFDADGSVCDVIDWDKAGSGWPAAELVRALDHALHLDPVLSRALVEGYRSLRPLSPAELDHAAANWNYSRVHDHWVLEGIYLRQDDRLRIFLEPGPFVPFADQWRRLRPQLG